MVTNSFRKWEQKNRTVHERVADCLWAESTGWTRSGHRQHFRLTGQCVHSHGGKTLPACWVREWHVPAWPALVALGRPGRRHDEGPGLYSIGNGAPQMEFKQRRGMSWCVFWKDNLFWKEVVRKINSEYGRPKAHGFLSIMCKLLFLFWLIVCPKKSILIVNPYVALSTSKSFHLFNSLL